MAEKTAQNFKGNFKYILFGVAEYFPMNMWDSLIPQSELTCTILHQLNVAPKVSAQAYAFGPHDFNRMPLSPMGFAVQIHEKPSKRKICSVQSVDRWYLQTFPHHYRCCEVWNKHTGEERILDKVFFKNKQITNTTVSPEDAVVQAAKELIAALKRRMPSALERSTVQDLEKLDKIFNKTEVIYKENRNDDPPPQRVSRTNPPYHSPTYKKEPERETFGENEMAVTSSPFPQMDPQPKPNNISNNDGDTPKKKTELNGGHLHRRSCSHAWNLQTHLQPQYS